jgi:hypothetical protein
MFLNVRLVEHRGRVVRTPALYLWGPETDTLSKVYQFLQQNAGVVPWVRQRRLPSVSFAINCVLIILSSICSLSYWQHRKINHKDACFFRLFLRHFPVLCNSSRFARKVDLHTICWPEQHFERSITKWCIHWAALRSAHIKNNSKCSHHSCRNKVAVTWHL